MLDVFITNVLSVNRIHNIISEELNALLKEFSIKVSDESEKKYRNLINFIGESPGYLNYLHTTNSEENAKSICKNGLRYEIFYKTVDNINSVVALIYMLNIRKPYGNFTIVIQIDSSIKDYESISEKTTNEDGDEIYVFPPRYIKGYYDRITNEIFTNPLFEK